MNGKFLTSDEEERTSLELSIMLVLADKIWGDDSRFLNGHEIADVVNGIIVDDHLGLLWNGKSEYDENCGHRECRIGGYIYGNGGIKNSNN